MANWKWNDASRKSATIPFTTLDAKGQVVNVGTISQTIDGPDLKAFLAGGGVPDAEDPTTTPTLDDIYDQTLQNSQVLKAVVLAFIGGTLMVGMTSAAAKAAIKAKM
jgi:hypothetical protein